MGKVLAVRHKKEQADGAKWLSIGLKNITKQQQKLNRPSLGDNGVACERNASGHVGVPQWSRTSAKALKITGNGQMNVEAW